MPRVLDLKRCPHCRAELSSPPPRVCVECGGSLQQRFLQAGCISSSPILFGLFAAAAWFLA